MRWPTSKSRFAVAVPCRTRLPEMTVPAGGIAQVLKQAGLVGSTSEGMRQIEGGGVRINGEKVSDKSLQISCWGDCGPAGWQAQVCPRDAQLILQTVLLSD